MPRKRRSLFPNAGRFESVNGMLRNCRRFYPHKFAGGVGFFVARIRRKANGSGNGSGNGNGNGNGRGERS